MSKDEYTRLVAEIAADILSNNHHMAGINLQLDPNLIRTTFGGAVFGSVELAQMIVERSMANSDYQFQSENG